MHSCYLLIYLFFPLCACALALFSPSRGESSFSRSHLLVCLRSVEKVKLDTSCLLGAFKNISLPASCLKVKVKYPYFGKFRLLLSLKITRRNSIKNIGCCLLRIRYAKFFKVRGCTFQRKEKFSPDILFARQIRDWNLFCDKLS